MHVIPWALHGAVLFEPTPFVDDRGFFVRTSSVATLGEAGLDPGRFVEESQSRSRKGVLRGLHGRSALSEGKLVRCARGSIFEVVVDLRPWSSTFLGCESIALDDELHQQLWIPPGLVHGFQVTSAHADVCYRMDAPYEPSLDLAVAWDDPELAIEWPIRPPVLSTRDQAAPRLADVRPNLETWFGAEP